MSWSWKLGTIAGIEIRIHLTFALLVAWIAWSHYRTAESLAATGWAVLFLLVIFAVVLAHELGHALTARRFGIGTRNITLLPIGGVAALERMPDNPGQELLVAIAGPGVNAVIAALLYVGMTALGVGVAPADLLEPGGSFAAQLLWINIGLAAFNLLPAFPMDGGRALRASLAMRMDAMRATRIAAWIGQGMAGVFAVGGLLWSPVLLFIALFVWLGARGEAAQSEQAHIARTTLVSRAMNANPRTLSPRDTLESAVHATLKGDQLDFPVVADGRLVGLLTRDHIGLAVSKLAPDTPVSEVVHKEVGTVVAEQTLEEALKQMSTTRVHAVPVVGKDGKLVGLLTQEAVTAVLRGRS